ncbi:MAG: hypothetical protein IT160_10945 [Bryobacterales bacterium]|nr:hypothetical protein [Bryobacterales bacterium]
MILVLQQIFEKTLARLAQHLVTYVPPLIVAGTIIAVAWLLAVTVRWMVLRVVKGAALDRFLGESGLSSMLDRSGRLRGAALISGACYWIILAIGILTALDVFDTTLTSRIIEATVFSVPKLVTGLAILVAGFWLGQYLNRSTIIWAVNEGMPYPRRLAAAVRIVVVFVAIVVAAEALDFAREVFFAAFIILIGSAALASAIALGFGLRGTFEKRIGHPPSPEEGERERSLWSHL